MRTTLALAVFVVVSCFVVLGQTSIEYSTIGSGTAVGTSKAGGAATNALGAVGKRLDKALNSPSSSAPVHPTTTSPDKSMRSNRQLFDQQAAQQGCSNLHLSSAPKDATLFVDHLAVAATPADLCLPLGRHILEVKSPGFKTWSQEVTISPRETLSLAPTLVEEKQTKEYKRTVNVSF